MISITNWAAYQGGEQQMSSQRAQTRKLRKKTIRAAVVYLNPAIQLLPVRQINSP
jgi:hypothetical protein